MQPQGTFIKFCIFLSELGALRLLFLILNPKTMWVIHLNVAVKIRGGVHKQRCSFHAILYWITHDALGQRVKEYNISNALILGTEDTSSTGSKLGKLKWAVMVSKVSAFIAILLGLFIHFWMRSGLCYFYTKTRVRPIWDKYDSVWDIGHNRS